MTNNPDWKNIKRILILGCSGTGKSTLAKQIGKKFDLEVIHLDKFFHKPNWEPRDIEEFRKIVKELILKDKWVMDGNYTKTLAERIRRANFIIFFDYNSYLCTYRVIKRNIKTKLGLEIRTDMAEGCVESWLDWEFIKFVWNFKIAYIPLTYQILEESKFDKKKLIIIKSRSEGRKFIKNLEQ
ncbi:MAG TPA: topology modulation protein [Ignavibacteria bacterium]|nr:topology modulation protein [Ignavibacteria bacterium]